MTAEITTLQELEKRLELGKSQIEEAKTRLLAQKSEMEQQVVKLDSQARQALSAGREDLARTALERKQTVQSELQKLDQHISDLEAQQQKLIDSEATMRAKLEAVEQERLGSSSWWQTPAAFSSLGFTKFLTLTNVSYYGGWPGHQAPEGKSNLALKVDVHGISLRKLSTIFTIPWSEISDIAIEGPEQAQRRFTATRLVALGPLGLAFKKDSKGSKEAIITVVTQVGDEAIFHVAKTLPREISPKLEPLAMQARRAARGNGREDPSTEPVQAAPDLAGQIEKLADLRAKGILTDEEFANKKAELLARM
ncbi:MAG: SHOCT domain-containing protein [Solirubrobacteraceae bacterium]